MRFTADLPFAVPGYGPADVLTDEAIASLVGQTPRLSATFDGRFPLGTATVVAAERAEGGYVRVTLETPDEAAERFTEALGVAPDEAEDEDRGYGAGFRVRKGHYTPDNATRVVEDARLYEVATCPKPRGRG